MKKIMNNQKIINKQVETFVQEICVKTWGMDNKQVKAYCLNIAKQNLLMSDLYKDYLQTAISYAKFAGLKIKEIKNEK